MLFLLNLWYTYTLNLAIVLQYIHYLICTTRMTIIYVDADDDDADDD
jgi:hypothetical protein